jgi:hypothetical protein
MKLNDMINFHCSLSVSYVALLVTWKKKFVLFAFLYLTSVTWISHISNWYKDVESLYSLSVYVSLYDTERYSKRAIKSISNSKLKIEVKKYY